MKKKAVFSLIGIVLLFLLFSGFQFIPSDHKDGEYYQAEIYIDAQNAFSDGEQPTLFLYENKLYLSKSDMEQLFDAGIERKDNNIILIETANRQSTLSKESAAVVKSSGITYYPLRDTAESLGYELVWEEGRINLLSSAFAGGFSFCGVKLGISEELLFEIMGTEDRKDIFSDGTKRYLYHIGKQEFFMADVRENTVCGLYSNTRAWTHEGGIGYHISKIQAAEILKEKYYIDITKQTENEIGTGKVILFFDREEGDVLRGVAVGELFDMDQAFLGDYSLLERELCDLVNAERVMRDIPLLDYDSKIAECAKKHSQDMGARDYFSHSSPDDKGVLERLTEAEITFQTAGENIAAGYRNIIFAHHQLMNSISHREHILGKYQAVGIGIAKADTKYQYYYTQNYCKFGKEE